MSLCSYRNKLKISPLPEFDWSFPTRWLPYGSSWSFDCPTWWFPGGFLRGFLRSSVSRFLRSFLRGFLFESDSMYNIRRKERSCLRECLVSVHYQPGVEIRVIIVVITKRKKYINIGVYIRVNLNSIKKHTSSKQVVITKTAKQNVITQVRVHTYWTCWYV
mgnify:CR=1 FL=1